MIDSWRKESQLDIITARAEAEIEIKKSRFIAIAEPVSSLEEVKLAVNRVREEHPDATHVVHAAVVGNAGTMYSSSDDREPKNTAGRPALEVLKGSGITNICISIIRYFGGTLLGTGGLVKAYGDSVKEVLKVVSTEPLIEKKRLEILLSYEFYTLFKRIVSEVDAKIEKEDFGTGIVVTLSVAKSNYGRLVSALGDLGQGRITIRES